MEDIIDAEVYEGFLPRVEAEWRSRFSSTEHHDLSMTPAYRVEDAGAKKQEQHLLQAKGDEEALRDDAV